MEILPNLNYLVFLKGQMGIMLELSHGYRIITDSFPFETKGAMLRAFFISLSKAHWAQRLITRWKFAWRMASRFIAGESLEEALQVVRQLNQAGITATLDQLGENTTSQAAAEQATADILLMLDGIQQAGVQSNVSIKLSQLGLVLDPELAYTNLKRILDRARQHSNFIRVDMEDSSLTAQTIDIVMRAHSDGYENVGTVIQSYLYRSEEDIRVLAEHKIRVRLVKGAYREPASVAYPEKSDVDTAFDRLTEILLTYERQVSGSLSGRNGLFPPLTAIGSHDLLRLQFAADCLRKLGLSAESLEFQFLYGIRRDLQHKYVDEGYPVRVYVPFGTHWYPYFMRRLAERPANIGFFINNFFKK